MKEPGTCTLCKKVVFEVVSRFASDHYLAGRVRSVGHPLECAWRYQLVLCGGSRMDLTFCDECVPTPENLPEIWRTVCEGFSEDNSDEYRNSIGRPISGDRVTFDDRMMRIVRDLPIGVLSGRPWAEELNGT